MDLSGPLGWISLGIVIVFLVVSVVQFVSEWRQARTPEGKKERELARVYNDAMIKYYKACARDVFVGTKKLWTEFRSKKQAP